MPNLDFLNYWIKPLKLILINFWFLFLITPNSGFSQNISGVVKSNDKAIEYVNVLLYSQIDSTLSGSGLTDSKGVFNLSISRGKYYLIFSIIGWEKKKIDNVVINENVSPSDTILLGNFDLRLIVNQLDEIKVSSIKPSFEFSEGIMSINISKSALLNSGSILDVLEQSPSITIDKNIQGISINGSSGIKVMVDGKELNVPPALIMQYLENLQSVKFEKIEVTNFNSSKQTSSGSGVLNLITKKNLQLGMTGSINSSISYGFEPKYNGGVNLYFKREKLDFWCDYSLSLGRFFEKGRTFQENLSTQDYHQFTTNLNRVGTRSVNNLNFGSAFRLNSKTDLTLMFSGYNNYWRMHQESSADFKTAETLGINSKTKERNDWINGNTKLSFNHKFKESLVLSGDIEYLTYRNTDPSDYENYLLKENVFFEKEIIRGQKKTSIDIFSVNIDLKRKINNTTSVETGLKFNNTKLSNYFYLEELENGNWKGDSSIATNQNLNENVIGGYAMFLKKISESLKFQLGVRYEYNNRSTLFRESNLTNYVHYGNLFPSFNISKSLLDNKLICNFSFNATVNRPAFTDLAPFTFIVSPSTLITGNVNLKPALEKSISTSLRYLNWNFTYRYSYTNNPLFVFQPERNLLTNFYVFRPINFEKSKTSVISLNGDLVNSKHSLFQIAFTGLKQFNILDESKEFSKFSLRTNINYRFRTADNFSFELSGFYQSPILLGMLTRKSFSNINIGILKKMGNHSFQLTISDIFWKNRMTLLGTVSNSTTRTQFERIQEPRIYKLVYILNIGNLKTILNKRNSISEEIKNRVSN